MSLIVWDEPDERDGVKHISMTREQLITHYGPYLRKRHHNITDNEIVEQIMAIHWAWIKED